MAALLSEAHRLSGSAPCLSRSVPGFKPSAVYSQVSVFGVGGKSWHDIVGGGDRTAYLGMACADLPNFFFVNGPNTNISHHSAITMGEANMRYIVHMLQQVRHDPGASGSVEVQRGRQARGGGHMDRRLLNRMRSLLMQSQPPCVCMCVGRWTGLGRRWPR